MGDDLNNYKKLAERLTDKWLQDASNKLKLDPEIKKRLDELEAANAKKQPTADDKKKFSNLELDIRKLAEKKMAQSVKKLEMDFNNLTPPDGAEPEKIRTIQSDILEDMEMDGIQLNKRLKLGLDVDAKDSPGDVGVLRLEIRFGKKR